MPLILDIGCGKHKTKGAIGIDIVKLPEVDIVMNIENKKLPFKNNTIDEIHCYHTLEHVANLSFVLDEFWRVLKEGGRLYIKVPHFSFFGNYADPTHKRSFSYFTFDFFTGEAGENISYYYKFKFKIIKRKLHFHKNIFAKVLIFPLDVLANTFPKFYERYITRIYTPTEIEVIMVAQK